MTAFAELDAQNHYETSRALAVRPNSSDFALGTEYWLRAYDAKGEERWKKLGPAMPGASTSRRGLWRWHDPMASLERWPGTARLVRRAAEPQMGRLDAVRDIIWHRPVART